MAKACSFAGLLAIALLILSTTIACRPSEPCEDFGTEDFGTVVTEVPKVPGAEEPYVIPELGPSTSDVEKAAEIKPATDTPPVTPAAPPTAPKSHDNPPTDTKPKG